MMNGTTVSPASAFPAIQSHMGLPLERGARGHPAPGSPTLPHTIITHHHHHPSSHATSTWNPRSPQASPSTLSNPSSPLGLCCQKNTHRPPRHPTTGGGAPKRPGDERHWSNFVQIYFDNFPLRPQRVAMWPVALLYRYSIRRPIIMGVREEGSPGITSSSLLGALAPAFIHLKSSEGTS